MLLKILLASKQTFWELLVLGRHSIGLSRGIAYQHTIGCATFTNRSLLEVVNRDTARGKLVWEDPGHC